MSGILTHTPAEVIAQLLIDMELGSDPDVDEEDLATEWLVHAHKEPDVPDSVMTVYDTSGIVHGSKQVTSEYTEYYGIQVRFRAPSPTLCRGKAYAVQSAFDTEVHHDVVNLDGIRYRIESIDRSSTLSNLSKGEAPTTDRTVMTLNFVTCMRQID